MFVPVFTSESHRNLSINSRIESTTSNRIHSTYVFFVPSSVLPFVLPQVVCSFEQIALRAIAKFSYLPVPNLIPEISYLG